MYGRRFGGYGRGYGGGGPQVVYVRSGGGSRRKSRGKKLTKVEQQGLRLIRKYPLSKHGYLVSTEGPEAARTESYGSTWKDATEAQRLQRKESRFFGHGKYGFGKLARSAWKVAKPYAKRFASQQANNLLGSGLYTGQGEYESNELVGNDGPSDLIPQFQSASDETGALTVTHREYVGEIFGNDTNGGSGTLPFVNRVHAINPGLETTFPWLSQIAQNFEEYEFSQLMFTYRSVVADVSSANGQVGTVIMATQYNPSNPPFPDKAQMLEYTASMSGKTTSDMIHGVEMDNAKLSGTSEKYVRAGGLETNEDLKQYDHGIFQIATANTPVAFIDNSIGELWVSYTVHLRKPKVFTGRGGGISRWGLVTNPAMIQTGHFMPTDHNNLLGTGSNLALLRSFARSSFQCRVANISSTVTHVTLPADIRGVFRLRVAMEGAVQGGTVIDMRIYPPTFLGNVVPFNCLYIGGPGGTSSIPSSADEPTWFFSSRTHQPTLSGSNSNGFLTLEAYVKVQVASNASDNVLVFTNALRNYAGGGMAGVIGVTRCEIKLEEVPDEAWATSATVDAPRLLDSTGYPYTPSFA